MRAFRNGQYRRRCYTSCVLRAAPTAENMLDLLDLVIAIIVDTRAIDLGRAAPLRPLVQSLAQPGATAKDTARLFKAATLLVGGDGGGAARADPFILVTPTKSPPPRGWQRRQCAPRSGHAWG